MSIVLPSKSQDAILTIRFIVVNLDVNNDVHQQFMLNKINNYVIIIYITTRTQFFLKEMW
jgi:hypothetical protein